MKVTKESIKETWKLMKKYKSERSLVFLPDGKLYSANHKTGKINPLPDGKEIFG